MYSFIVIVSIKRFHTTRDEESNAVSLSKNAPCILEFLLVNHFKLSVIISSRIKHNCK